MSSKINVYEIIVGHINTLKTAGASNLNKSDILTFYGLPITFSMLGIYRDFSLSNDLTSLFVNFGSIFTALLLSVLVLIYDQENKLDQENLRNGISSVSPLFAQKKKILNQLYYNICYCIIGSMALVVIAAVDSVIKIDAIPLFNSFEFDVNTDIFAPFCIFISLNLILTIIMIVKRMHALLISNSV